MGKRKSEKYADKRALQWREKYQKQRELHKQIRACASDILQSKNFKYTKEHIQHGNMTVNSHCLNVAKYSLAFSRKLHIKCNERELIRGALLHDYFLYDWHDKDCPRHHFTQHPRRAAKNAKKDFKITKKEEEIILSHMFPTGLKLPKSKEAVVLTLADKHCATKEFLHLSHKI